MSTSQSTPQVAANASLHEAAKCVIELHRAQYIRGNGDGGRVSHAFMQLEKAVLTPAPETAADRDRLRDALTGNIASFSNQNNIESVEMIAACCYRVADAMLEERAKAT